MDILELIDGCPGEIYWLSCRYLIGVLEIFNVRPGDIFLFFLVIFHCFPGEKT